MPNPASESAESPLGKVASSPLAALLAGVLPVWLRHLQTSREQSAAAVADMLQAFSDINPHLGLAERQAHEITQALNPGEQGMMGLGQSCQHHLAPLLNDPQLTPAARQAIERVLALVTQSVSALEEIAKPFSHETHVVAAHIERMYMGFQYQDRLSQMLALLEADLQRMQSTVAQGTLATVNVDEWLKQLQDQYVMAEQHLNHAGRAPPGSDAASAAGDDGPTFF